MKASGQLTLSVQLPDDETFASYKRLASEGRDVPLLVPELLKSFIKLFASKKGKQNSFYLFGLSGVGKSHLLHATCAYADELGLSSQCIPLRELASYSVDILDGLESVDVICIDDIDVVAGNIDWERALFDLYNRLMENNKCLIVSANKSASELEICLPDLRSRLSWGETEQLKPLSDQEKLLALQYRAQQRGLTLSDEAAGFLLNNLSRNMKDLLVNLEQLDQASIKEQRKLTIPFIKQVLL